jgi:Holliday junction DNA helicase RuvA
MAGAIRGSEHGWNLPGRIWGKMIGYLEGRLLKVEAEKILLLVNHVGYEVMLPTFVRETLNAKEVGDEIALYIFYHVTERQPKPVLIGFNLEAEKEFFQHFISVEAIGPLKAVKALNVPIRDIANAIELGDVGTLKMLKGIGARTAQKIVASLQGKVSKFALIRKAEQVPVIKSEDITGPVLDVLVNQLGHRPADAKRMVAQALEHNEDISTPEALFDEVYKVTKDYER